MNLFDAYLRLADPRFSPAELAAITHRAVRAGVSGGLVVGTTLESSRSAIQVADRLAPEWELWAAVGVHPAAAATLAIALTTKTSVWNLRFVLRWK